MASPDYLLSTAGHKPGGPAAVPRSKTVLVRRSLQRRGRAYGLAQLPPSAVVARSQHVSVLRAAADLAAFRTESILYSRSFGSDRSSHGPGYLLAGAPPL